nr:MAG TPA: hypothetical protein [Caudoviricetes sp.]
MIVEFVSQTVLIKNLRRLKIRFWTSRKIFELFLAFNVFPNSIKNITCQALPFTLRFLCDTIFVDRRIFPNHQIDSVVCFFIVLFAAIATGLTSHYLFPFAVVADLFLCDIPRMTVTRNSIFDTGAPAINVGITGSIFVFLVEVFFLTLVVQGTHPCVSSIPVIIDVFDSSKRPLIRILNAIIKNVNFHGLFLRILNRI